MSRDFEPSFTPGFAQLETGRLTWLGLSVAAIGWALLIGAAAMGEAVRLGHPPGPLAGSYGDLQGNLHGDLVAIAQCLIGSGFALAVIGSLQAGFGALNRFFGAVLTRSSARVVEPQAAAPFDAAAKGEAVPAPARRPYRTLPDGSVEVDTILGTRRFATMGAARDFI